MILTPLEAAKLIIDDYAGHLSNVHETLDIDGCQSAIVSLPNHAVRKPILLIRGSNETSDWLRNFDFLPSPAVGDTCFWHRGMLRHAQIAYGFTKGKDIGLVIGHSLGAACVQIVATSLGVPGLAFAAPRPLWAPFGAARPANEGLVTCYNRTDDMICDLPFAALGFSHVGTVRLLTPATPHPGQDHCMAVYLDLLQMAEDLA